MPIRIGDERAVRIEPPKSTSIFIGQTPSVFQENRCPSPWVRGIVVNRRQAQHGNTSSESDAIKSVALKEIVRVGGDDARLSCGHTACRHHIQRERFEHKEIAPAPGDSVTGAATGSELDKHVTSVDEGSKFRTFTARRCPWRMSCNRGLGQFRIVAARPDRHVERLPARERLIPNNEIAGQVLTAPRHRQQNVMVGQSIKRAGRRRSA